MFLHQDLRRIRTLLKFASNDVTNITYNETHECEHLFTPMRPQPSEFASQSVVELKHLRLALARLEGIGAPQSKCIQSLQRTVRLQIAELEAEIDEQLCAQAVPLSKTGKLHWSL